MTIKKIFLISSIFLCTVNQYIQTMFFALTAAGVNETNSSEDTNLLKFCCEEFCCDVCMATAAAMFTILFSGKKEEYYSEKRNQPYFKKEELISEKITQVYFKKIE